MKNLTAMIYSLFLDYSSYFSPKKKKKITSADMVNLSIVNTLKTTISMRITNSYGDR